MSYIKSETLYQDLTEKIGRLRSWYGESAPEGTARLYFDWLEFLVRGFWDYVISLADLSNDTRIYFYDIEASEAQFHESFGVYPAIELDVHMSQRDYTSALHEEPAGPGTKAFAPAFTGAYVIVPVSGKWHIHGEYALEMAELISYVGVPPAHMFPHDFWIESEGLSRIRLSSR